MRETTVLLLLVLLAAAPPASGQGDYVNFEEPVVRPLALAMVDGTEVLAVCNTPDNSIELRDPVSLALIQRVAVGLSPVSVRFSPALNRLFTADWLGDSVSSVQLTSSGPGQVSGRLLDVKGVVDEPMDLVLSSDGASLFVVSGTTSEVWKLDAATLALDATGGWPVLLDLPQGGTLSLVVKEGRRIEVGQGRIFVLNFKGGNENFQNVNYASYPYDLDLFSIDEATGGLPLAMGTLGTTNAAMQFAPDGSLWVVGSKARNQIRKEDVLALEATGFVQSRLYQVTSPGQAGQVKAADRDLNLDPSGQPFAPAASISQPYDLALLTSGAAVSKIFVAGFGSGTLQTVFPSGPASTWDVQTETVPQNSTGGYTHSGPRGLVLSADGSRLYSFNRLNHSVSRYDTQPGVANGRALHVLQVQMTQDPTPTVIRQGRGFLYGSNFSGNGKVACASCHFDARTDSLAWDLGVVNGQGVPKPPTLPDRENGPVPDFPSNKGFLVTQSLQGLVNSLVNFEAQRLFSNAPYHWRGDRPDFESFNVAFPNLLGASQQLSTDEMTRYRKMIDTVSYPPNSLEPRNRVHTGSFGTVANDFDPASPNSGDGALLGLKAFHLRPLNRCAQRSCVHCHALPEGSNNRQTTGGPPGDLETAALRGLGGREGRLEDRALLPNLSNVGTSDRRSSQFGLTHAGLPGEVSNLPGPLSTDRFVLDSFGALQATNKFIAAFVREFDTGIAPAVGLTHAIKLGNKNSSRTTLALDLIEDQVSRAHVGGALIARIGGILKGYWYDVTTTTPGYREEGSTGPLSTRAQILAQITAADDLVLAVATPIGSDRRIASTTGVAAAMPGTSPTSITLLALEVPDPWTDVPQMTDNWDPHATTGVPFAITGVGGTPRSMQAIRMMQNGILQFTGASSGLPHLRHEAPRRFRVIADGIQPGAFLDLRIPRPTGGVWPLPAGVPLRPNSLLISLPLFPSTETVGGKVVWKTAAWIDPTMAYALMLGGPSAPNVQQTLDDPGSFLIPLLVGFTEPHFPESPFPVGFYDPTNWNQHHVMVRNADGRYGAAATLQTITLQ